MARKTTVAEAVVQVARNLSLVSGNNVQPYSGEQIVGYLEGAHQLIIDTDPQLEFPDLMQSYTRTLDGVTGFITQTVPDTVGAITSARIKRVYSDSQNRPLPLLSNYNNPLVTSFPYGFRLLGAAEEVAAGGKYLIQVFPITLGGQIQIQLEVDFDLSDPKTVIPIDWWLHVYHASWQYAADDGTNQLQIEKYKNLYNERFNQVKARLLTAPISLDPLNTIPNQWSEYDSP